MNPSPSPSPSPSPPPDRGFDHERLEVYQIALRFARFAVDIAIGMDGADCDTRDQLRRASSSVVLNIAEGAGEFAPAEKARFYRMARRSATECAAVLDIAHGNHWISDSARADSRGQLLSIVAMLTVMIKDRAEAGAGAGARAGVRTGGRP